MSRPTAETSVEGLVHSIAKSKNFKRLAGYSIECLNKLINKTASDWVEQCALAVKLGGLQIIVDVLANPSTSDAGIFVQATQAIAILASSSARAGATLGESHPAVLTLLRAFVFYWDTTVPSLADSRKQLSGEDKQTVCGTAEAFASILLTVSKNAPRALLTVENALGALARLFSPEYTAASGGIAVFHPPAANMALQALALVRGPAFRSPPLQRCACVCPLLACLPPPLPLLLV